MGLVQNGKPIEEDEMMVSKMVKDILIAKELDSKQKKANLRLDSKPFVGVQILGKYLSLDFPLESPFWAS